MKTEESKSWSQFGPSTDQAISGFLAGAISTIILHPLDLLKVRLQVQELRNSPSSPISKLIPQIYRAEGGLRRGLYRGLSPNFAGSSISWGLYFFYYSSIKEKMAEYNTSDTLSPAQHLSASALAGAATCLVANPLFVVKTRMFTQSHNDPARYKGVFDGLRRLYMDEGVKGLYRGIVPALFGVSHGAIQFMAYEQLKIARKGSGWEPPTQFMGNVEYIGMAACSKIIAALCTYPYQVVKSRMQTESKYLSKEYDGVLKTISSVYRYEGFGGFYKGLRINIIRVLPGTMITFGAYEFISTWMKNHAF